MLALWIKMSTNDLFLLMWVSISNMGHCIMDVEILPSSSLGNNNRSSGSISNFQQIHHLKGCWWRERADKKRSGYEVFAWLKRWKCFVMSCPSSFYIWYMIANNIWIYESTKEIGRERIELVEDEQLLFCMVMGDNLI